MEVEIQDEIDPKTEQNTSESYVFETAANRPDLLSTEGIVNAF